jgi:hypothetical protein
MCNIYLFSSHIFSYISTCIWDLFNYGMGHQDETRMKPRINSVEVHPHPVMSI